MSLLAGRPPALKHLALPPTTVREATEVPLEAQTREFLRGSEPWGEQW